MVVLVLAVLTVSGESKNERLSTHPVEASAPESASHMSQEQADETEVKGLVIAIGYVIVDQYSSSGSFARTFLSLFLWQRASLVQSATNAI